MKIVAVFLMCLSLSALAGEPPNDSLPSTHVAELRGENEVPAVETNAAGVGSFSYNPVSRTLTFMVGHTVTDATAAHIHGPANEGENGDVVFVFDNPQGPMVGSFSLTEDQEADLLNGLYYVNVHSDAFPSGELRGQILGVTSLSTRLSGDQEVPPVETDALGFGSVFYNSTDRVLTVHIVHTLLNNVTGAHIHGPAPAGENGGVVFALDVGLVTITGEFTLTPEQEGDLLNGLYYINIHTDANPGGELRGQILPRNFFVGVMSGLQEFPPNTQTEAVGAFAAKYDPNEMSLAFLIDHDVVDASAMHIHGPAAPGQNAGVVFDLGDPTPPAIGEVVLDVEQEGDLFQGLYYINVHSPTFPAGEIRGQMRSLQNVQALLADYYDVLTAWASEAVDTCFGEDVDILDIIAFLDSGLVCPTAE